MLLIILPYNRVSYTISRAVISKNNRTTIVSTKHIILIKLIQLIPMTDKNGQKFITFRLCDDTLQYRPKCACVMCVVERASVCGRQIPKYMDVKRYLKHSEEWPQSGGAVC